MSEDWTNFLNAANVTQPDAPAPDAATPIADPAKPPQMAAPPADKTPDPFHTPAAPATPGSDFHAFQSAANKPASTGTDTSALPPVANPNGILSNGQSPSNLSGLVTGSSPDTWTSGAAKGAATAGIKGVSGWLGFGGDIHHVANILEDRAEQGVRYLAGKPKPYADIQKDNAATMAATKAANPLSLPDAPDTDTIAAPVLKQTGEYQPTSGIGKAAMAGEQMAIAGAGPGGVGAVKPGTMGAAQLLKHGLDAAPTTALAGSVGEAAQDATGNDLVGLGAGLAAPAAAHGVAKVASAAAHTKTGAGLASIVGNDKPAQNIAAEQVLRDSSNPQAVYDAATKPANPPTPDAKGNVQYAPENYQTVPGSTPTLPEVSADTGLIRAQRGISRGEAAPEFQDRAAANNAARQAYLQPIHPDAAPEQVANHIADAVQQSNDAADQKAAKLAEAIPHTPELQALPADQQGEAIRTALARNDAAAAARQKVLYDAVDPHGILQADGNVVQNAAKGVYDGLSAVSQGLITPEETTILDTIHNLGEAPSFEAMADLSSHVDSTIRQLRATGADPKVISRLARVQAGVKYSLNNTIRENAGYQAKEVAAGVRHPDDTMASRYNESVGAGGRSAGAGSAGEAFPGDIQRPNPAGGTAGASGEPAAPVGAAGDQGVPGGTPSDTAPRVTTRPAGPAQSLLNFIQRRGGMSDPTGDLKAAGLDRYPGLITREGEHPDKVRSAAAEEGYLGADTARAVAETTPNDLIDKLSQHPTYSVHDEAAVAQRDQRAAEIAHQKAFKDARQTVADDLVKTHSFGPDDASERMLNHAAHHYMTGEHTPLEAYEKALADDARKHEVEHADFENMKRSFNGHFDTDAQGRTLGENGRSVPSQGNANEAGTGAGQGSRDSATGASGGQGARQGITDYQVVNPHGSQNGSRMTVRVVRGPDGQIKWINGDRAPAGLAGADDKTAIASMYGSHGPGERPNTSQVFASGEELPPTAREVKVAARKPEYSGPTDTVTSALRQAGAAETVDRATRFGEGPVGEVLAKGKRAGEFKITDEKVAPKVWNKGAGGSAGVKAYFKAAPDDPKPMHDAAISSLADIVSKTGGRMTEAAIAKWRDDYSGALREIDKHTPGFSNQFDSAAKATKALDDHVAESLKAREDQQKGVLGSMLKAHGQGNEAVTARVGSIIRDKQNGVAMMRQLAGAVADNADAQAGLHTSIADAMSKDLGMGAKEGASSVEALKKAGGARKAIEKALPVLKEGLPPEAVDHYLKVADDIDVENRKNTQTGAGPSTAENLSAAQQHQMGHGSVSTRQLVFYEAATLAGEQLLERVAHAIPDGLGLPTAAVAAFAGATALVRNMGIRSIDRAYKDMLLHPDRAGQYFKQVSENKYRAGRIEGILRKSFVHQAAGVTPPGGPDDPNPPGRRPPPPGDRPRGPGPSGVDSGAAASRTDERGRVEPTVGAPGGESGGGPLFSQMGKADFDKMVSDNKAKRDAASALIDREISKPNPRLVLEKDGKRLVLSKGLGDHALRMTDFDGNEPTGHRDYNHTDRTGVYSMDAEVDSALRNGYKHMQEHGTEPLQAQTKPVSGDQGSLDFTKPAAAAAAPAAPKKLTIADPHGLLEGGKQSSFPAHEGAGAKIIPSIEVPLSSALDRRERIVNKAFRIDEKTDTLEKAQNAVATRVRALAGQVPVHAVSDQGFNDSLSHYDGFDPDKYTKTMAYYDPTGDRIVIRESALKRPHSLPVMHTLLHEAVHAALYQKLQASTILTSQIMKLRKHIIDRAYGRQSGVPDWDLAEDLAQKPYGMTQLNAHHEFLTEALTSANFQKFLSKIELPDEMVKEFGLNAETGTSAWSGFVGLVRKALGLGPKTHTALDAMMHVSDTLFKATEASQASRVARGLTARPPADIWGAFQHQ